MPVRYVDGLPEVKVIAGPTASGKTALSISMAHELDGEIVSADSMQIYKYMDIGTAKPTLSEREGIPHHMMDFLDPAEEYSVADYVISARAAIRDIIARGRTPVVVGGTGLYISALVENINYTEEVPDPYTVGEVDRILAEDGPEALYGILKAEDPGAAAGIDRQNVKRVRRMVIMKRFTRKTLAERNAESRANPPEFHFDPYIITRDRAELYDRIDRRVLMMIDDGLVDEVRSVRARGMGRTASQAIGYKEIIQYLDGAVSLDEAVSMIQQGSRNYAKRQLTWFRRKGYGEIAGK